MDVRIRVTRWFIPAWGCAALLTLLVCPGWATSSVLAATTDQVVNQAAVADIALQVQQDDPPAKPKENAEPKKGDAAAEREALIEAIKAQAEAKKAAQAKAREQRRAAGTKPAPKKVLTTDQLGPTQPAQQPGAAKAPGKKKAGCGKKGSQLDLTPPPLDQPQPKFACKATTVTIDPVWQGNRAEFTFEVGNEGEGPLHIHLKGG